MNHNNYHRLMSQGRKAGLNSQELNQAFATRPVAGDEQAPGQSDCNGYVSDIDSRGYRLYRQAGQSTRN
jgi:hypothetical protein